MRSCVHATNTTRTNTSSAARKGTMQTQTSLPTPLQRSTSAGQHRASGGNILEQEHVSGTSEKTSTYFFCGHICLGSGARLGHGLLSVALGEVIVLGVDCGLISCFVSHGGHDCPYSNFGRARVPIFVSTLKDCCAAQQSHADTHVFAHHTHTAFLSLAVSCCRFHCLRQLMNKLGVYRAASRCRFDCLRQLIKY